MTDEHQYYSPRGKGTASYIYSLKLIRINIIGILLKVIPLPPSLRVSLYRIMGIKFTDPDTVFIGKNVVFDGVFPENITIEGNVMITHGAVILTHYYDPSFSDHAFKVGKITIKENAFIGAGAYILSNSSVGRNAVVAAGSVVTKKVGDNVIVAGIPAVDIGMRGDKSIGEMDSLARLLEKMRAH